MRAQFALLTLTVLVAGSSGCGSSGPAASEIRKSVQVRVASMDKSSVIRDEPLLEPKAVARFYTSRKSRAAWSRKDAERIVEAIEDVRKDGLNPDDYHLKAIQALVAERKEKPSAESEADLDVLLTDAVAGIIDHVRYGRVHPVTIDPHWNADPRDEATPLEYDIARIPNAGSVKEAIEGYRPKHFIYRGLMGALAQLREIEAKGGWPQVPAGKTIKPGMADPRIRVVRARLAIGGDLTEKSVADSTRYDAGLEKAVKLFQARHRLNEDGILDKNTIDEMNVTAGQRAGQVRANLERARWVLGGLEGDFLLVNLPAFKAYLIQGGKNVWEARTQIGEEALQTPSFRAKLNTVVFNPDWTVPPIIIEKEIIPAMQRGEDALTKQRLAVFDGSGNEVDPGSVDWGSASVNNFPYSLKQPPGPGAALGRVKFLFPNKYSIYLHDTPSQSLFGAESRSFSHGCIRLERALELAEVLLRPQGWTSDRIQQALATTETQNVPLKSKLPIVIVYWTVSVGASGEVRYAKDIYGLDQPLAAAMETPRRSV